MACIEEESYNNVTGWRGFCWFQLLQNTENLRYEGFFAGLRETFRWMLIVKVFTIKMEKAEKGKQEFRQKTWKKNITQEGFWKGNKKCQKDRFQQETEAFKSSLSHCSEFVKELSSVITTWMSEHLLCLPENTVWRFFQLDAAENDNAKHSIISLVPRLNLCPFCALPEKWHQFYTAFLSIMLSICLHVPLCLSEGVCFGLVAAGRGTYSHTSHRHNGGVNTHSSVVLMAAFCRRGDWIRLGADCSPHWLMLPAALQCVAALGALLLNANGTTCMGWIRTWKTHHI